MLLELHAHATPISVAGMCIVLLQQDSYYLHILPSTELTRMLRKWSVHLLAAAVEVINSSCYNKQNQLCTAEW